MLRSSCILNECNLSCKIVKTCRIIGLNRAKKNKYVRGLYDKKQRLIVLFTSDVMKKSMFKRLVCTPPDLSPRFTCKVSKLIEHKKSGMIFHFGLPFRQRNGTCKFGATKDYRVFHKIIFRGCPIIHSLLNGVVGETVN